MSAGTHRGQKRTLDPPNGVTGGCELPDVGGGNGTWVFCKNDECSFALFCFVLVWFSNQGFSV